MSSRDSRLGRFVAELKRRRVLRAAAVYAAAAWLVVEVSATVLPALHLPEWTVTLVVILALAGFPLAIVMAWALELGPEGVRRTSAAPAGAAQARGRRAFPRWLAVLAVAVFAGVGTYLAFQRVTADSGRRDDRLGIAVFPFRPTGAVVEEWSEGLADLLSTVLDGTHGIRVADPWSLWQSLRSERAARARTPDRAEASRLARQAGAKRFVLGSLVGTGQSFDLNVRLYSVDAEEPLHSFTESGAPNDLGSLAQRLALVLIPRLVGAEEAPSVPPLSRYTTDSADALKAYLAAKAAMRSGLVDSANVAIDRALALDSTFALALVEAAAIKTWVQYMRGEFFSGLMELAERAVQYSDSLGERDRLRAEAMLASINTNGPAVAEATGRILEIDSTDFQAWNQRAYSHMVYGWQYGVDEDDMLEVAERVVQLDSTHVPGLLRRAWLAVSLENTEDIRLQLSRLEAVDTTSVLAQASLAGLRATLASDTAFSRMAAEISKRPARHWLGVLRYLRTVQPARAESLLARVRPGVEPGRAVYVVRAEEARLLLTEGRVAEVDSAIRAGDYQVGELWKNLRRFQIGASLSGVGDEAVTRRSVEWLSDDIPADSALSYFETRPVWWSGWLVAAHHAMFGDTTVTHRWHAVIGELPPGGTSLDYRGALQSDLEARLAARRGDLAAALTLAKRAFRLWSIHTDNEWEASPSPQMRFNLALLYRAAGQPDSAEALLRSLVPPTSYMGFLTARSSFELGELAENRDDLESALSHYRRAFRYWSRGGPEVIEWRSRAETALGRVISERRH